MKTRAFTIIELVVVLAITVVLVGIIVPSLQAAMESARRARCAAQLHALGQGLMTYAAANNRRLPPFAFSDAANPDLVQSGHWGGIDDDAIDMMSNLRRSGGMADVNLQVLVAEGIVAREMLICPSADGELASGEASWFAASRNFSTYCVRMPYSRDLFRLAPGLADRHGDLMGIYKQYAGGQMVRINAPGSPVGRGGGVVPQVRIDRRYRLDGSAAVGDAVFDPSTDAIVADAFVKAQGGEGEFEVAGGPSHGKRFNVLSGDGAVKTVMLPSDTLEELPCAAQGDDGPGLWAESVWQRFDGEIE
jgi:hypothetical protein